MDKLSESLTRSSSALSVEYRGQQHKIPIAKDRNELKRLTHEIVLPSLKRLKKLNPNVEIAITEYVYLEDEPLKDTERKLTNMFKDHAQNNVSISRLARISRKEGLNPVLSDRISWRKDFPNDLVENKVLPFARRTFLMGPMVVNETVLQGAKGPSLEEDITASSFFVGNAFAFDGDILLKKSSGQHTQINNEKLLKLISPLIKQG